MISKQAKFQNKLKLANNVRPSGRDIEDAGRLRHGETERAEWWVQFIRTAELLNSHFATAFSNKKNKMKA